MAALVGLNDLLRAWHCLREKLSTGSFSSLNPSPAALILQGLALCRRASSKPLQQHSTEEDLRPWEAAGDKRKVEVPVRECEREAYWGGLPGCAARFPSLCLRPQSSAHQAGGSSRFLCLVR